MRLCVMIALAMIGAHIQMPWYYWVVLSLDLTVALCRGVYEIGKRK